MMVYDTSANKTIDVNSSPGGDSFPISIYLHLYIYIQLSLCMYFLSVSDLLCVSFTNIRGSTVSETQARRT